ncbi:MAG: hypothetical protein F2667_12755 [Actinobacteria bacterium]|uniref:Unannotated protein n=1 Tax=freshwater metagenome TaxID=449393 RepID=A0A6J6S1Z7_9ZZZZ|nr:hypothetical protein [Actinomycetota bacterium]
MVRWLIAGVVVALLGASFWFEPWRLFTSSRVIEAVPTSEVVAGPVASTTPTPTVPADTATDDASGGPGKSGKTGKTGGSRPGPSPSLAPSPSPTLAASPSPTLAPSPTPSASVPAARDVELDRGEFVTAEHPTTGIARVLQLADGRRFVRLEGFDTSDGPDLHVWLSDQPSGGEWGSYDDARSVPLGELKATSGDQNYEIPASAEIGDLISVVIWCDRFDVAFGTAAVDLAS